MKSMLPVVDVDLFLADPSSPAALAEANKCANAMIRYGAILIKDSRASETVNSTFLDTLEDYFAQSEAEIVKDTRPEVHFQVGATLENTEQPKCYSSADCQALIRALDPAERPLDLEGGKADPKQRFFRRLGKTPPSTEFATLAMSNVVPAAFASSWDPIMDACGGQLQAGVHAVVEMLEVGLGLEKGRLSNAGEYGPHLLAPTATDLKKYGKEGEIFAGFHCDIGCIGIHGRSRYPGLNIWARNTGKRLEVRLPSGCLLVQAGKELEHLTGGLILAGFHEVICSPATLEAMTARGADPATADRPLIRISSTSFWQLESDYEMDARTFVEGMRPTSEFVLAEKAKVLASGSVDKYPVMKVGTYLLNELRQVALMS